MINEENLNKLYEGLVPGKELTTKELNSYGFNSKDLNELIEQGKIERVKRGYYKFIDVNSLYKYGKKLSTSKEYDKAYLYFKKCYDLDHNNLFAVYQLFIKSIKDKDYNEVFKYLEILLNNKNPFYIPDYSMYLYLLSFVTDIPEKYQEYTKNLKLEDIGLLSNDRRYKDIQAQQRIRNAIINKRFAYALKQLNDLTNKNNENTVQDVIMRILIIEALETENKHKEIILGLIKEKQYEKVIIYLQEKKKKHNLTNYEEYIIKLSELLLDIQKTKVIPKKKIISAEQHYEAIDGCNYELALELLTNYNQKHNIDNNTNIIYLLLNEIHNLIKKISKEEQDKIQKIQKEKEELIKVTILFTNIINYLIQNDIDNALNNLSEYLTIINKKEYEFIIVHLIKISILENDSTFTKSIVTLTNISRNNYNFDMSTYIQEFYLSLSQNKFEVSKIYLDIINNAKLLGQDCAFVDNLSKVLTKAEETVNEKTVKIEQKNIIEINSDTPPKEDKNKNDIYIEQSNEKENTTSNDSDPYQKKSTKAYEVRNSEAEFIESKYQQLLTEKGVVLLKPMDKERRLRIYDIVDNYTDVVSFSIGEGETKQIVLRYKPYIEEYVNIKQLLRDGNLAYTNQEYDKCIECYLQILSFGTPQTYAYAKIGLAYMKKFEIEKAITYLTIATNLSKEKGESFDFRDLIDSLKGISNDDKKPRVVMKVEEFKNDLNDYYGITNFEQINEYIIASGLDVDSACIELNMNEEQRTRIKLLYAREYYSQGEYDRGDLFLQSVERNKNKSKFIKKQLEEVRKSKRFYINRAQSKPKKLSLTLKPKK